MLYDFVSGTFNIYCIFSRQHDKMKCWHFMITSGGFGQFKSSILELSTSNSIHPLKTAFVWVCSYMSTIVPQVWYRRLCLSQQLRKQQLGYSLLAPLHRGCPRFLMFWINCVGQCYGLVTRVNLWPKVACYDRLFEFVCMQTSFTNLLRLVS